MMIDDPAATDSVTPSGGAGQTTVAAVDLGSNSFHMVIARLLEHDMHIIDRLREPVCLAGGLDADGQLTEEAQERALASLERFGQRLRPVRKALVRAVGTSTLRRARNSVAFRQRAERALGHPIEVISGQEEARLIYLGVAHSHASNSAYRLVVDIGGGSTEVIVGEGFEVLRAHSLHMGCVGYSRRFFPGGELSRENFVHAETAARLELRAVEQQIRSLGWDSAVGSSGTVNAIGEILRLGDARSGATAMSEITLDGLTRLRKSMTRAGHVRSLELPGLRADRAPVLAGGLSILRALFESLGIASMSASPGALREGILYDLDGRLRQEDMRDRTIRRLVDMYHADVYQAVRVERTSLTLFDHLKAFVGGEASEARKLLTWAAKLHEMGLAVSHAGFHKHGAYLVANSYMPGFSADDQQLLAAIIRGHRRKIARTFFENLPTSRALLAQRLCVIFRLAVLLNRGRSTEATPVLEAGADGGSITLTFPAGWLGAHPLTAADLDEEAGYLKALKLALRVVEEPRATAARVTPLVS
ncbi:MAG: exopolyphosphatase [Planctomycetota bacterium]